MRHGLSGGKIEGLDLNEGCGSPIAPHDGAETANWEGVVYNDGESEWVSVNLNGVGAYLGLPKAINGGELTPESEVPQSRMYTIMKSGENEIEFTSDGESLFGHLTWLIPIG